MGFEIIILKYSEVNCHGALERRCDITVSKHSLKVKTDSFLHMVPQGMLTL